MLQISVLRMHREWLWSSFALSRCPEWKCRGCPVNTTDREDVSWWLCLHQEIQELLKTWSDQLRQVDRIFLRAPSFNRSIFFGGREAPLRKDDLRIRTIPIQTRRPTFHEVQRIHRLLATVRCHGNYWRLVCWIELNIFCLCVVWPAVLWSVSVLYWSISGLWQWWWLSLFHSFCAIEWSSTRHD